MSLSERLPHPARPPQIEGGETIIPPHSGIHIIRVFPQESNLNKQWLLAQAQSNTAKIYHREFAHGIARKRVQNELYDVSQATTLLAVMKLSPIEQIGLAGNMQLSSAGERNAAGVTPPLEYMAHLIAPGGNRQFFEKLGVKVEEVGELGRFVVSDGPKRDDGDQRPTYRDYKVEILQTLLDASMVTAKEKGLKKVVLIRHANLDELFENAGRIPQHFPGSHLVPNDPFNAVAQDVNRFYDRYSGYWRRKDGAIPQLYVFDVDAYLAEYRPK